VISPLTELRRSASSLPANPTPSITVLVPEPLSLAPASTVQVAGLFSWDITVNDKPVELTAGYDPDVTMIVSPPEAKVIAASMVG